MAPPRHSPPSLEGIRRHTTVLVIASHAALRRLICRHLSAEGFRCFEADSAMEALEVLWMVAPGKIDLIIADADMPDLGAAALARASRERWPEQSVLFLFGGAPRITVEELTGLRGQVLEKPFTRKKLLTAVAAALERRRTPRAN
jgi:DNA-binding response OmpR family regulator